METIISDLHRKFLEKSWNNTFQLVRRCMDKSRDESTPCELLQRSMQRLQEVFNVSSMKGMKTCLETIAKQHELGFHVTDGTCYLTADLLYLEVALLPCGAVKVVNVAPHRGAPVASNSFLELLRSKDFVKFSKKLEELSQQYSLPGDNEIKLKLFESLQALGRDLEQMSQLERRPDDLSSQSDLINNGVVGSVISEKQGGPLTVQYHVSPVHGLKTTDSESPSSPGQNLVHTALLTMALSDVPHRLQLDSSLIQPPQLDAEGRPLLKSMNEVLCDPVQACFLLKLQPPVAVMSLLWSNLSQITNVPVADVDLQWAPLPQLLSSNSHALTPDKKDIISTVSVAEGAVHIYVFPTEAWDGPAHRGTLVDTIPFTHLSHVPALLELLRHQCTINSVLSSAITSNCATAGLCEEQRYEVLPETDTSFTVTFHPPDTDSLAVLMVDIPGSRQVSCRLFGARLNDSSVEQCLSSVMTRCHCLPVTLQTLSQQLKESASRLVSPSVAAPMETDTDHVAASPSHSSTTGTTDTSTTISHSAPAPDHGCSTPVSQSELLPEINPTPPVSPCPLPPVGVFLPWRSNKSKLSDPI